MRAVFPAVCAAALGYGVIPSYAMRWLQSLRRRRVCGEGALGRKVLFLTFDDGPSDSYTPELLELLKKYGIKASFFVVAEFADTHKELIRRMQEEGHLVGIHSVRHQNSLFRGGRFVFRDMTKSVRTLENIGCKVRYYRPPWGHLNLFTIYFAGKLGLKIVFWDVMAEDWEADTTPSEIRSKLLHRVYPGAMICLHDGRGMNGAPGRTIAALREALPVLLERGYTFQRVDTLH